MSWSSSHPCCLLIRFKFCHISIFSYISLLFCMFFLTDLICVLNIRQIWWVDIKCCQRWLWRHSGWVSGSPNLTCRLTKVDQGHQQPKHLISWISIILIQRKISVCSDTICWSSVEICHLERGDQWWPVASVWQKTFELIFPLNHHQYPWIQLD